MSKGQGQRRRLVGKVTSNKMTKTVVVEVANSYRHPLYGKVVHRASRFKAHDEHGCQMGDTVQIIESRPISKDKRWVVESVLNKAVQVAVVDDSVPAEVTGGPAA
jgi:small subunit ribosomal protein S17